MATRPAARVCTFVLILLAAGCAPSSRHGTLPHAAAAAAQVTSTHAALIRVPPPPRPGVTPDVPPVDFAAVLRVVDACAAESGLSRVPAGEIGQMHMSWRTSSTSGNEQVVHYR